MSNVKMQAISNNPSTNTVLALAEVSTQLAQTPEELHQQLENIQSDVGLVIITSGLAAKCEGIIESYRVKNQQPLIVVIPDPEEV